MPIVSHRFDAHYLTPSEAANLRLLRDTGCTTAERALKIYKLPGASVVVLARLCARGLAAKRAVSNKRGRFTLYWLTPAGVLRASALPIGKAA